MATSDVVLSQPDNAAVPADYDVPAAQEIVPKVVTASFDGSGAAGLWTGELVIIAPGNQVVARCPCPTNVVAGGSADISWFPGLERFLSDAGESTYEQIVLSNPHVRLYFKHDELSGTAMRDSGPLAHDGTYVAGPTLGQPPLADGASVVWPFAGAVYGEVDSAGGAVGTGELSVATWIKTAIVAGSPMLLVNGDDNNFRYVQLRIEVSGKLGMINFDAPALAAAYQIVSPGTVNDGARHFVVGTLDTAGTQTLYVDGAQVAQNVAALPTLSTRLLNLQIAARIAGGPAPQNRYAGTQDETALYDWALTAAEVSQLYHAAA